MTLQLEGRVRDAWSLSLSLSPPLPQKHTDGFPEVSFVSHMTSLYTE